MQDKKASKLLYSLTEITLLLFSEARIKYTEQFAFS